MTERVRALLDEAIAGLEPSDPDPVARVVARGRAARRRRAVGVAMAAVVVLVGGGYAVNGQLGTKPAPLVVSESHQPPTPKKVGDTVVAGDLVLPVPKGWRVVPLGNAEPCGSLTKTIVIGGPDKTGCQTASIEVRGTTRLFPAGYVVAPLEAVWPGVIISAPKAYTLRGGAPAWLEGAVDDQMNSPENKIPEYSYHNQLLVPWSKVEITFRVPGPEQQQIIDTIRTSPPRRASGLELPDTVQSATLTMPGADGVPQAATYGRTKDPATIAAVLELLRTRTSTVDNAHACSNPAQRTARLVLSNAEPFEPDPSMTPPSKPSREPVKALAPAPPMVLISLGDGCQEAVSADGGRVHLSDATLDELVRLFGIKAR